MKSFAQRTVAIALLALAGWGVGVGAAAEGKRDTALGSDGLLYTLERGTYGQLFGQPDSSDAANSVLTLRIERPDAPVDRILVANTGGVEVEGSAALVYEESSQTLFVAWESTSNFIHSRILLTGFSNGAWTDTIDVSGSRYSWKSSPRLAVTREIYRGVIEGEETDEVVHRTVLHVVWVEDRAEGHAVLYSPLVLVNGVYSGPHTLINLLDLVAVAAEAMLPLPLADLPLAPTIQRGTDDLAVILGFVDPRTGRLVTLDLDLLSGEISSAADAMRGHMIDIGSRYVLGEPGGLAAFADAMRGHMIDIGHHLEQRLLPMIADDFRAEMLAIGAKYRGDLGGFADVMRGHMIDIGVRLRARGLRLNASEASGSRGVIDLRRGEGQTGSRASNLLRYNVVASRALAEIGAAPRLFLSSDGANALVAWEAGARIEYRESEGAAWSDIRSLSLGQLNHDRAYEILEERIRNR